jgi:hypothetical protein
MIIQTIYKNNIGYDIEQHLNGFYSVFVINKGYLKADTLSGILKLLDENTED